jgi:hypothetical protein
MTTPLPSTPGDQREDHAQHIGDTVAAIYEQVELLLIATIAALARKTATGTMTLLAAQRQLARTTTAVLNAAAPRVQAAITTGMTGARTIAGAQVDARTALQLPTADTTVLAQALDTAGDNAAASAQEALTEAARAAQAVQSAVASTRGGLPGSSLSLSRIQAAQKALDTLGRQGITGYTDRAGRRWNLTSYVEMATRTTVSQAWDDMQATAMIRSGLDLVRVYTHSLEGSCPQCLPWLGLVLSLTGATADHPTLAEAKASGFRHPNCRCSWAAVGAGVAAEVTNPVALDQAAAVYRASQHQRALERRVRAAGRRAHGAITPQARAKARRDLAAARAASDAHRHHEGLRMTKASIKRREHPFGAH